MESDGVCLAFSIDTVFIEDCIRVPDVFTSPKLIYLLSSDIEESTATVLDKYVLNSSFPSLSYTAITDL